MLIWGSDADITFAKNSLDQDQDQQNIGADLDPNHFKLWKCSWKIFLENIKFETKKSADDKKSIQHAMN